MAGCIFCGTKDNVTTSMKVKTASGESTVPICATHEDEASPKRVRELVEARDAKIAEMTAILEPMGFKIVPIVPVGAVAVKQAIPAAAQAPVEQTPAPNMANRPKKVNSAAKINAPAGEFGINEGYDTTEAPALLESEVQEVLGVGGVPVRIPKKLVTEAGTSEIQRITGITDKDLQNRFKGIADGDTKFKTQDYGLKDCTFCGGTGRAKIGNAECPRCKGVGQR